MRSLRLLSLSSTAKLLTLDDSNTCRELVFDHINMKTAPAYRSLLRQHVLSLKEIECSLIKNTNFIRYKNLEWTKNLLELGLATINDEGLKASKLYTSIEKDQLIDAAKKGSLEKEPKDITLLQPALYKEAFKAGNTMIGLVEYITDSIYVSVQLENHKAIIPIKLKNIKIQAATLGEAATSWFLGDHLEIKFHVQKVDYDLFKGQNVVVVSLVPTQVEYQLLRQGMATINWQVSPKPEMIAAERQARLNQRGIFQVKPQLLKLINTKVNFSGIVTDVLEGNLVLIYRPALEQTVTVELMHIKCPTDEERGAYQCREALRRLAIGKEVNTILWQSGLKSVGSVVRIHDAKDLQILLLEQGWASIKPQLRGSIIAQKYQKLEQKAKAKHIGLYQTDLLIRRFEDLTNSPAKKLPFNSSYGLLQTILPGEQAVIEQVIDPVTYKLRIESKNVIIKVVLKDVYTLPLNDQIPQCQELKKQIDLYTETNLRKRTVLVTLISYEKPSKMFVAQLKLAQNKKEIQEELVRRGMVILDTSQGPQDSLLDLQNINQAKGVGVWDPQLQSCHSSNTIYDQMQEFQARVCCVVDEETVYLQPQSRQLKLAEIDAALNDPNLIRPAPVEQVRLNGLYAATFEGKLYRAKVITKYEGKAEIFFIDWGNSLVSVLKNIYPLKRFLLLLEPQCIKVQLHQVRLFNRDDYQQDILEKLTTRLCNHPQPFRVVKIYGNRVRLLAGQKNIIFELIAEKLLRPSKELLQEMQSPVKKALKNKKKTKSQIMLDSDSNSEDELMNQFANQRVFQTKK